MEHGAEQRFHKWKCGHAEKEAGRDILPFPEKTGQLIGIAISVILVAFFAIHQTRPTGFFSEDDSGRLAAMLIYVMLIAGTLPMFIRFITGHRNVARPYETIGNAAGFVATLYLLIVFPLDFSHFAEPLPRFLEFLLDWIPTLLAKCLLGIGVVGSLAFSIYTPILYLAVRKRLEGEPGTDDSQVEG